MLTVGAILLIAVAYVLGAITGRLAALDFPWRKPGPGFWLEPPC